MDDSNNINFEILTALLEKLKKQKKEELTKEELAQEYNDFAPIYHQFQEMRTEASKYGIDASKIWETNNSAKEALEQLYIMIKKAAEYQTQKELEEEIEQTLELLFQTNGYDTFLNDCNTDYTIIKGSSIPRNEKIKKLKEILTKIKSRSSELKSVKIPTELAKQKIKEIEAYLSREKSTLLIYDRKSEIKKLQDELNRILATKNNVQELSESLLEFIQYLDEYKNTQAKIESYHKHKKEITYKPKFDIYSDYEIWGVKIVVNKEKKTCYVHTSHINSQPLKESRIRQIVEFLTPKIARLTTEEIIKPTCLHEKAMLQYMKEKQLPLADILKVPPENFLHSLGINTELRKDVSIEQILKLSNSVELQELLDFIKLLQQEGFEIQVKNEQELSVSQSIIELYQSIYLKQSEIYKIIGEIIKNTHPTEEYIYSTLQIIYNCIDRTLIKNMHEELKQENKVKTTPYTKQVINIISKYAKKENGEQYTEEEIITFLKSKNMARNSDYRFQNVPTEEYSQDESFGYSDMNEIYRVVTKLTGRRH